MVAPRSGDLNGAVMLGNISTAREVLADTGLRVTRQRAALTNLLFGNDGRHVSAEGLHAELVQAGAPGSISSVYRALKDFSEAGLIRRVPIYGTAAYFDTRLDHHHHFYAEGEDRLLDLPSDRIRLGELPSPPDGYELVRVDVLMRIRRKDGCRQVA